MIKRTAILFTIIIFFITNGFIPTKFIYAKTRDNKFIQVITLANRIIALKSNGTMWEWYYPKTYQLKMNSVKFNQINGISKIASFVANDNFCLALDNNGSIWAWGNNEYGQLGDGTLIKRNTPIKVKNLSDVSEISIDQTYAVALKRDRTVWIWGEAGYGKQGTSGPILMPVKMKELSDIVSISAAAAVKKDGTVWTWGYRTYGSAGVINSLPRTIPDVKDAVKVSSAEGHTIAQKKNGSIVEWGHDDYITRKPPKYTTISGLTTVEVEQPCNFNDLKNVDKVFAGYDNFLIKKDGTILAWGDNSYGQLGIGMDLKGKAIYEKINTINNVVQISNDRSHTIFLKNDGTIWFCGYKLIISPWYPYTVNIPENVNNLKDIKDIAVNFNCSTALKIDGTVWMWGLDSNNVMNLQPKKIIDINNVVSIGNGGGFITFLKNDGSVWAQGSNLSGGLGDSTIPDQSTPVKVPALENISAISSSTGHGYTLALKKDGTVWGFGNDELWKLPNPKEKNISMPQMVEGLNDIVKIDAGDTYALALGKDGSLWCWRYMKNSPDKISGINDIKDFNNGVIQEKDGSVWVINENLLPCKIEELPEIKAIYKNYKYCCFYALDNNGNLWNVGTQHFFEKRTSPAPVISKVNIKFDYKKIKTINTNLALQNDGTVLAWGSNEYGQIGNGDCSFLSIPTRLNTAN